ADSKGVPPHLSSGASRISIASLRRSQSAQICRQPGIISSNSMPNNWFDTIRLLLRSYNGGGDKTFAVGYRTAISDGLRSGELSEEQIAALDRARSTVEAWYQTEHDTATNPIEEWLELVGDTSDKLPQSFLDSLLARMPQHRRSTIDWRHVVFDQSRSRLRVYIKQKVLKLADLIAIAKADPVRF